VAVPRGQSVGGGCAHFLIGQLKVGKCVQVHLASLPRVPFHR
jgi:hypothetical protein